MIESKVMRNLIQKIFTQCSECKSYDTCFFIKQIRELENKNEEEIKSGINDILIFLLFSEEEKIKQHAILFIKHFKEIRKTIMLKLLEIFKNCESLEERVQISNLFKKFAKSDINETTLAMEHLKNAIKEKKNRKHKNEFSDALKEIQNLKNDVQISPNDLCNLAMTQEDYNEIGNYYTGIPKELIDSIIQKKCILMIGSGISRKCFQKNRKPLPNWYEFTQMFIEWMKDFGKLNLEDYKELKVLLDKEKYSLIADELLEKIQIEEFHKFINEVFEPLNLTPSFLHRLIVLMPFRGILTINYDNLIERAYVDSYQRIPKIILNTEFIENKVDILDNDFFILKLHGDIKDPKSIILSQNSYLKLLFDSPNYREFLKNVFSNYSILFIGYGGKDDDIEFTIDKLAYNKKGKQNQHFLLVKRSVYTNIEKRRMLTDKNIFVIEYLDYFGYHNHVDTFFEDLFSIIIKKGYNITGKMPKSPKARIKVFYDKCDEDDGIFLWDFFFRQGAITLGFESQKKQYNIFLKEFDKYADTFDFLILFIGKTNLNKNNIFIKSIENLRKIREKYDFHIIITSLQEKKEEVIKKFNDFPVFYLPENFSDADLQLLIEYITNRISIETHNIL